MNRKAAKIISKIDQPLDFEQALKFNPHFLLYRSELEIRDFGFEKTSGFNDRKRPHMVHIRSLAIIESRGFLFAKNRISSSLRYSFGIIVFCGKNLSKKNRSMRPSLTFKRVLLKLSGESLMGAGQFGIDQTACQKLGRALQSMNRAGLETAIVIGGGNIFRGIHLEQKGVERTAADQMGMIATLINGIALQQSLTQLGCRAIVLSALECPRAVESFNLKRALEYLGQGFIVIFVGGTGNPYFTTDTAAALRASEIKADVLLKATKVDGIYDRDPLKYPNASKYEFLTYSQALADNLQVMDASALALCRSSNIPIFVFNMKYLEEDKILSALSQKNLGTLVTGETE